MENAVGLAEADRAEDDRFRLVRATGHRSSVRMGQVCVS
jgi:hypothetical protein